MQRTLTLFRDARASAAGPRACDGFSLLEVLVATMLLGLASLSYGALMLTASDTQQRSWERTDLSATASERMEALLQLPFEDNAWVAGGALTFSAPRFSFEPIPINGGPNGYLRWQISDESAFMKRITVLAGYRDPATNETREVQIETFRLRRER